MRRLSVALVVFGLIVLVNFGLFGWLIFRSLSQREIESALLETRREAEEIAGRIAERAEQSGTDISTVLAVELDTQDELAALEQFDLVQAFTVHDVDGVLVYRKGGATGVGAVPPIDPLDGEAGAGTEDDPTYQVVAIGDYGTLRVRVDDTELRQRIDVLQRELVRQAGLIAVLTAILLVVAYVLILWLMRRGVRLEEQAAEAERMAYIGTLASGLAHEIRNPLNSLNLNMQMLEEEIDEAGGLPTGGRLFAITKDEIRRLERLANDFLSYARPRALEIETLKAVELLEEAGEVLVPEARSRRVGLEVEDRSGGSRVRVDPGQIRQLVLNLAQNALVATTDPPPPPGRPARVVLAVERHGDDVHLLVEDNGPGVDEEVRQKMFDIFYSTKKGGTGLGLAIVERIAKSHGGTVSVDSEIGEGTTVRVVLPVAEVAAERAPALQGADENDPAT
jgi:signal transduction histidine kinase